VTGGGEALERSDSNKNTPPTYITNDLPLVASLLSLRSSRFTHRRGALKKKEHQEQFSKFATSDKSLQDLIDGEKVRTPSDLPSSFFYFSAGLTPLSPPPFLSSSLRRMRCRWTRFTLVILIGLDHATRGESSRAKKEVRPDEERSDDLTTHS